MNKFYEEEYKSDIIPAQNMEHLVTKRGSFNLRSKKFTPHTPLDIYVD